MPHINYKFIAILFSIIFWLSDSIIHNYIIGEEFELIPTDLNELVMRAFIVFVLILFGLYADYSSKILLRKEAEKHEIYKAAIISTQHILNNLLNQLQYIQISENQFIQGETKELFHKIIDDGKSLVEQLSSVENPSAQSIYKSINIDNVFN
ncbi:MAG: hypothetical protein OEZ38_01485 [Gammaproteobacteria bacterium]|nr:hypothetical protein [Gammaproteobacteria bacterium]